MLIRTDGAGASRKFLTWLHGQRVSYSIGFGLPDHTAELLTPDPRRGVDPACDAHDRIQDGARSAS